MHRRPLRVGLAAGLIAMLIRMFGFLDAETFLERWGREPLTYRPSAAPSMERR